MTIYWPDYVDSTCRSNVSYLASSEFMTTAYHATAIVTVPLSVFTFFVIIRVTPNKMKNMKTPLLIAHVWSTNLDLMLTVFLTPFMLFPSASGVIMGLFRLTGIHSKWLTYMGQVSIITLNNISMLLMACHGLMSTICTLFIIKPYWEFVKSLLKRQNECHPNEMWTNNKPKESVASITNFQ
uniref:G_PROTEIN_RECEP_F1_2 domain-containing protein n=1 Tax=Caenorhabditis tropicalis TaxID=1561998 RepID=A0A1I7UBD6_9PELO